MRIKNKLYNPHWEAIHDFHDGHRSRLEKQMKEWWKSNIRNKNKYGEDLENVKRELEFHNRIYADCLHKQQHKYVADCAIYLFENSSFDFDETYFPPPESFKTVDEVMAAYTRLYAMQSRA